MKYVPIILARGGSKGLPRKNIKELNGLPLIAYNLIEARKIFPVVYVSTDDYEIAKISEQYGGTVLFSYLHSDTSRSIDLVKYHIEHHLKPDFDAILLLNACCPLTIEYDISQACNLMDKTNADSVVSLVEDFSSHPTKTCSLDDDKKVISTDTFDAFFRQKLNKTYKRNTAIYIMSKETALQGKLFGPDTRGYVMPKERSWDINDQWDFDIAQFLIISKPQI